MIKSLETSIDMDGGSYVYSAVRKLPTGAKLNYRAFVLFLDNDRKRKYHKTVDFDTFEEAVNSLKATEKSLWEKFATENFL